MMYFDPPLNERCTSPSEEFKQQRLEKLDVKVDQHHFGEMRLEVAQAKAERIIGEELRQRSWEEAELTARRKRDPSKVEIAMRCALDIFKCCLDALAENEKRDPYRLLFDSSWF